MLPTTENLESLRTRLDAASLLVVDDGADDADVAVEEDGAEVVEPPVTDPAFVHEMEDGMV